ncbi:MAG TPA: hypothetical protein VMA32_04765 [Streptosporangiaceae bacterium]|nr:hypothetical protein [Streptosporangiaceae bacterium]
MSSERLSRHEPRNNPASKRPRFWPACIIGGAAVAALLSGAGAASAAPAPGRPGGAAGPASSQVASEAQLTGTSRIVSPSADHPGAGPLSEMQGYGQSSHVMPVHGQVVLAKPGGGYRTVDFQSGTVTKVDAGSITLRSTDGFTQSYAISGSTIVSANRDGIGSVKTGNDTVLIATVSGRTATAVRIIDVTQLIHSHQQLGLGPAAHP